MMSLEEGEKMRPRDLNDERERERERVISSNERVS